MSCNGCRVLRKGCSETCILRPSLQWIESPEAQGYATVFVAKFFGRAGLMSFLSAVPQTQRPAIFQSLLFEAAGRTVNPVNGAVGLLWTGNWNLCQAAVETVLRGGSLQEFRSSSSGLHGGCSDMFKLRDPISSSRSRVEKRRRPYESSNIANLDLSLTQGFQRRPVIPSRNSEESGTTTCSGSHYSGGPGEPQLLNLF